MERWFNKSGKVETKSRARIDPITTTQIMMYSDTLKRKRRALRMSQVVIGVGDYEIEANEEEPPAEWRNDWFRSRKNK